MPFGGDANSARFDGELVAVGVQKKRMSRTNFDIEDDACRVVMEEAAPWSQGAPSASRTRSIRLQYIAATNTPVLTPKTSSNLCGCQIGRTSNTVAEFRQRREQGLAPGPETVRIGQDLEVGKVWYQKVRFLSGGWYPIFSEGRSGTKKCEKTLQMVRLVAVPEDPDQI